MNKRDFSELKNSESSEESSLVSSTETVRSSKRNKKFHKNNRQSNSFIISLNFTIRNDDDPFVYMKNPLSEFIKIGNFVYKTKSFVSLDKDYHDDNLDWKISLNRSQYDDVKDFIYDKNRVIVSSFTNEIQSSCFIKVELSTSTHYKFRVTKNELINYIVRTLNGHIVTIDQNIDIHYMGYPMTINIVNIGDDFIGKITGSTDVHFKNIDSNIVVMNQCIDISNKDVSVFLTKCISLNSNHDNNIRFPIIIDKKIINRYVKNTFDDTFTDNDYRTYTCDDIEYTFNIKVIGCNTQTKFKNTYKLLDDSSPIQIKSNTDSVILTSGKKKAKKICFYFQSSNKDSPSDNILFYNDLVDFITSKYNKITCNQSVKYLTGSKEIVLKADFISPHINDNTMYIIDSNTKISFNTDIKSSYFIAHNDKPTEIDTVTFKIKNNASGGLFSLMFGDDDSEKTVIFDSGKLEKTVRSKFPKRTVLKHKASIQYNGVTYQFVVQEIKFKEDSDNKSDNKSKNHLDKIKKKYTTYGIITSNTNIKFVPAKANKSYVINNSVEQTEISKNPVQELEKYVGGISKELETVVRTLCLSRGILKQEYLARGLRPVKGIILHGPPGTGKTSLSRNLGKILGCEGDRFRLMSGPEIFNKWVGGSESNVRAIFKPAKDAWKKHGDKSPVYMVVIDEIDAMLPSRSGSDGNPVRDSVVNQFLAEMDGLEVFNNLICIGITNRLELLDPATIRSGRFGIHIKIDLPDQEGRVKIFQIHTKKLQELNRLNDDVDISKLAVITEEFSGADIEGMVELASVYSLERLNKLDVINDDVINTHGLVTFEDFTKAAKEINHNKNKSDSTKDNINHMYL
ncbi:putative AAA family ATPase [Acanthamoeba polyphaga mimivirus]|nr:putative AAA family ATPase [Mimivirus reunion]WMV61834.1 putative AAA family ATPase [Mimivirus sp.]WMV62811.1 putative AAA family ATPase [Acanthamoeba polyphaga mimivirus]WMV63788.1 putative AAA family ATPase [Mimivirus sp.]